MSSHNSPVWSPNTLLIKKSQNKHLAHMCLTQWIHTYTKTHTVAQTWVAVEWSNPKRRKLMVYKTASDTINYVNWRCSDVDSIASAVVFPLIHLSSPSYHPFLSLPPDHRLPLFLFVTDCSEPSTVTKDPSELCLRARGRAKAKFCVCVTVRMRGRGREMRRGRKKVACTVRGEQPPQHWMMLHQGGRQSNGEDATLLSSI